MSNQPQALPATPANQAQTVELADIHLPGKPAFWPPAPGWWILSFVVLALVTWSVLKFRRYQKLKKHRQHIMQALQSLERQLQEGRSNEAVAEMNMMLRRLALMHYPHKQIASLTGKQWLEFLDTSGRTTDFSQGAGRILADAPYLPQMPESFDIKGLNKAVKNWVKQIAIKPTVNEGTQR